MFGSTLRKVTWYLHFQLWIGLASLCLHFVKLIRRKSFIYLKILNAFFFSLLLFSERLAINKNKQSTAWESLIYVQHYSTNFGVFRWKFHVACHVWFRANVYSNGNARHKNNKQHFPSSHSCTKPSLKRLGVWANFKHFRKFSVLGLKYHLNGRSMLHKICAYLKCFRKSINLFASKNEDLSNIMECHLSSRRCLLRLSLNNENTFSKRIL